MLARGLKSVPSSFCTIIYVHVQYVISKSFDHDDLSVASVFSRIDCKANPNLFVSYRSDI